MKEESIDILVIGAGPSGCVSAAYLKNNNLNVKVVEKARFPRYVIGESLLPKCMEHFEEVGLLECLKEKKFEKKLGARFMKNNIICNFDFSIKHTKGWDWTWQVPRDDFDNTLATEVQKKGVSIDFEHEVIDVSFDGSNSKTIVKDKNGNLKTISAKFIIDSSGYGRVLPRLLELDIPSTLPNHSSIFAQVKDIKRPEGNEGTLITFDIINTHVWLWVIPFSNGNTSIGFVGPTEFINSFEGSPSEVLSEMLKISNYYYERFKDVDFLFEPKIIQNFSKAVKQLYGNGYALTGNSAEFLDPVFSSGVTFATASGLLAAKLACKQLNNESVDWETEYVQYIKEGVDVFSSYINEWYTGNLQKLFFHRPENLDIKKQICAVLAGYVWDKTNPFVTKHKRIISIIAHTISLEEESKKKS
ncbi:MAG: tryptophan 7-halogenase [Flavobacteriaceae bacterium]|nr:tryptophan 7-halogenase [Flavobacteriaceae bacterium]